MNDEQRAELEAQAKAAARSRSDATPADLARVAELLMTVADAVDASGSEPTIGDDPPQPLAVYDGPMIGGLKLKWREFRGRRRNEDGSDGGEVSFGLWVVVDDLAAMLRLVMDDETHGQVKRMPYFGIVWPSAESLVTKLLASPSVKGRTVLDLGCGLGFCGFAAAALGARVTFFDWEPRALEIVAASAREQGGPATRFNLVLGDWGKPPRMGAFDLILGADLLYEQSSPQAVAAFVAKHLKPGAEAWLTDPGRPQAWAFIDRALAQGLELLGREVLAKPRRNVDVTLLRFRRPMLGARSGIRGRLGAW